MTTRPELADDLNLLPGLAAGALFVVMAAVFVTAPFGVLDAPQGFPEGASITASIGYAMFNVTIDGAVAGEGMLIPFEIIDMVLVAALAGAILLARRETEGSVVTLLADGGRELSRTLRGGDDESGGEEP